MHVELNSRTIVSAAGVTPVVQAWRGSDNNNDNFILAGDLGQSIYIRCGHIKLLFRRLRKNSIIFMPPSSTSSLDPFWLIKLTKKKFASCIIATGKSFWKIRYCPGDSHHRSRLVNNRDTGRSDTAQLIKNELNFITGDLIQIFN